MNQPQTDGDYQKLLTDVIKKQIVILGPDITLAKARNVKGLTITDDGTVTAIAGNPQLITQQLVEQFMELSGLIVKKTMEPLLANYPDNMVPQTAQTMTAPQAAPQTGENLQQQQPTALQQATQANTVQQTATPPINQPVQTNLPAAPVQSVEQASQPIAGQSTPVKSEPIQTQQTPQQPTQTVTPEKNATLTEKQ